MTRGALRESGLWLAMTLGFCAAQASGAATAPEYQIKAVFLYKFATYVRWPPSAGADAAAPFVIGVIGQDPFGPALNQVVQNQQVQGRAILVRRVGRLEDAPRCNLLFISS